MSNTKALDTKAGLWYKGTIEIANIVLDSFHGDRQAACRYCKKIAAQGGILGAAYAEAAELLEE